MRIFFKSITIMILLGLSFFCSSKIYDNRTLKTSAKKILKQLEITCEKDFMDCIDHVEGMRQPKEYRESKNPSKYTIKLNVKSGCKNKVLNIIRSTTKMSYEKAEQDAGNNDDETRVFSINGVCEDAPNEKIIFESNIYTKDNSRYGLKDIELCGVNQQDNVMVIYCTTYARRDDLVWKIFDYLYIFGYGNVNHFVCFSFGVIIILIFLTIFSYIVKCKFVSEYKLRKVANKKRLYLLCGVIVFVGIAFFLNMIMNFPMLIRDSEYYNFRPNCVEANHIGIWEETKYASYCKLTNSELIRSFIEMLSFVPIGMLLFSLFKKSRVIRSFICVVSISVLFELFGNWGYISHYYYQTLFFNILGWGTGLGILSLCSKADKKTLKQKTNMILPCVLIVFNILLFGFLFILGNTNILSSVYPDYYTKISPDKINVKMINGEFDEKPLYMALSEDQYDFYKNQYKLNINSEIYEKSKKLNIYYSDEELQELLDKIGMRYYPRADKRMFGNAASFTSYNEVSDGIYESTSVYIEFDEEGNPMNSKIYSSIDLGLTVNKYGIINNPCWYIMPNYENQGLDRIVSLERAYGKLCNGEGYAMGLVQLCENSNVNIVVNDVDIVMHINNMNCYEYVYCFCVDPIVSVDGTVIDKIYVPAMKSYYK